MIHELKPFHCPFCNSCFSSRDYGRHYNVSNFPLLLKCGHSVCETCVRNSAHRHKKIVCLDCQLSTDLSEGDFSVSSLLPDLYVLGILNANMKKSLPSLKMKMLPFGQTSKRHQRQNVASTICDECVHREACWRCEKCEESFCNICFDHVHSIGIKVMQKHEKKPIDRVIYNSMIQRSCKDHSNRDLEFFCDEDSELACSYCCVTGKHKGHNVQTLRQKNVVCHADLKSASEAALQVKKKMKLSEKKLSDAIPTLKTDNTPDIAKIHNYFHTLHAALQLREHELIEQVKEINIARTVPMEKIFHQLRDYQQNLDDLLLDAERTLRDPSVVINTPALIKKLEESRNLPQYLVPVSHEDLCDIDINFDEADFLPLLKSIGKINADVQEMYELKSPSDLPDDYVFDPVFDVASVTTETESVRSEVFSEDSLCGTLLSGKSDTPDTADILKNKQHFMSHAERVIVSHIRDPGKFWVQKCSGNRKLKSMSDSINKWCRSMESSKHMPSYVLKGDLYLVQYSADNKWYRARVKQIFPSTYTDENEKNLTAVQDSLSDLTDVCNEISELHLSDVAKDKNQKVEVLYVDYGNTEIVPVCRLKNIQTRFLNIPGMAKECSLYDIYPVKENCWSSDAVKIFAKFVGNKEVMMMISEERSGVLYVDLSQAACCDITNDVPVSVRDALVFLEHGQFTDPKIITNGFTQKNVRQFLPSDKLPEGFKCNVILSHIENPSLFYVQQVSTAGNLSNLINDMNVTYKSEVSNTLYQVYVPYVGMVCAAQYTVDKQWYRAQILSLPGAAMVEVQYVDFGNKEVLHNRYLRKLFDRFLKLSRQAIACSLSEIKPFTEEGWTPEAKNWMMTKSYKKQLYLKSLGMIEEDRKASVALFDVQENSALCLNGLMVEEGLATSLGPRLLKICQTEDVPLQTGCTEVNTSSENANVPETSVDTRKSSLSYDASRMTTHSSILAKRNYNENFIPVVVSHIETPGLFYLQLGTKIQEDLKKMMQDMQVIYQAVDSTLVEVTVGGMYAVRNEKEDKWCRGSVLEMANNIAKVLFVDFGFVQDVKVESIRALADHLRDEEPFCHRSHLSDIEPAGGNKQWPIVSIEAFKDIVSSSDSMYFIRKDFDEERNSLATDLYIEVLRRGGALEPSVFEYLNVADLLIDKGIVLPVRKKSERAVVKLSCDTEGIGNSSQDCSPSPESSPPVSSDSSHSTVARPHKTIHLLGKPTFRWKPSEKPTSKNFTAVVTYVDENASIFLHDKEKGSCTIDVIKKALCCKYSKADHTKLHIPPPVGQACIAKFHLDNGWYRGEIVSTKPESVKVFFVDYGNTENVPLDDICLDIIMTDTPAQAVECQLAQIEPATPNKKWKDDVLDFLHLAVVEKNCTVNVVDPAELGKPLQICLTLAGIDMRNVLIQMGSANTVDSCGGAVIDSSGAIATDSSDAIATDSSVAVDNKLNNLPVSSEKKTVKKDVPVFNAFKEASPLREGEPFQVCVTQLLEPNFVFLQQLKVDEPVSDYDKMRNVELENFLALMKELGDKAESMPLVKKPELGVPYCAKYSYDNSWYRCEVTNVCGEEISVLYIDYGNSEVIPVERLRKLDGHFVDFPVQSHFCKLHRVEPITGNGWSPDVITAMIDSLFHCTSTLHARVVKLGEEYEVELLVKRNDNNEWELAYQKLVDENLIRLETR